LAKSGQISAPLFFAKSAQNQVDGQNPREISAPLWLIYDGFF
jgi:hypothetical protein